MYPNNLPFQSSEISQGQRDLAEAGALLSGILLSEISKGRCEGDNNLEPCWPACSLTADFPI